MERVMKTEQQLTKEGISSFGVTDMAYIKQMMGKGGISFSVYAADGTRLATFASREAAEFTAKQHDLTPVSVH